MSTADLTEISEDMPDWLTERFLNIALNQPRFEASFGGPHNAMLHCFFPLKHSFMVKPIPRIRPSLKDPFGNVEDDDDYKELSMASPTSNESFYSHEANQSSPPARVSIDSNPPVQSRRSIDSNYSMQSGHSNDSSNDASMPIDIKTDSSESYRPSESGKDSQSAVAAPNTHVSRDSYNQAVSSGNSHGCPDFLVVKASGALNNDRALLIWELKRNDDTHTDAIAQRDRYETWARVYQHFRLKEDGAMPFISVALVEHNKVTIRTLSNNGTTRTTEAEVLDPRIKKVDPRIDKLLRKIARENA
ncbi:hypothetical protein BDZ89DRAFT_1117333 [Hymenopellis radicata]|nr:hypothetical protein BDZ89DRAFT_1117333 [Hymenopellis radicata]